MIFWGKLRQKAYRDGFKRGIADGLAKVEESKIIKGGERVVCIKDCSVIVWVPTPVLFNADNASPITVVGCDFKCISE
jgi:hypothetical protein